MRRTALTPSLFVSAAVTAVGIALFAFAGGSFDVVPRQAGAVILWWVVLVAAAFGLRVPPRPSTAGVVATTLGASIAIWAAVGVGSSLSAERSAIEVARATAHLAPIVLVGWVLPRSQWRAVVVGVAIGGTAVCVAALGERLSPGLLEETRTVVFTNTSSRLAAPLGYWNALGSWGVLTSLLLLALGSHAAGPVARALATAPIGAIAAIIYFTYSRSAMAAGVLGALLLVALARNRWTLVAHLCAVAVTSALTIGVIRAHPEIANATGDRGAGAVLLAICLSAVALGIVGAITGRVGLDRVRLAPPTARRVAIGGTVIMLGCAAVFIGTQGGQIWDRFSTTETAVDTTDPTARLTMLNNGSRVEQWKVAWNNWEDQPWRGSGAGTFELTYNRAAPDNQFVRDAHSSFLEALSEQGIVGFGLLLGFVSAIAAAAALAIRRSAGALDRGLVAGASAAVAAFLLGTAADWFWEVTALALMAMTLVGALIAASSQANDDAKDGNRRAGPLLRFGLAGCAVVAILVVLPGLVGTSEIRRSEHAVERGDLASARDHADRAIDTIPWASSPFLQRALVDEQAGAWPSARRSMQLAIKRDPYDWRLPLVLSRIEAKAGDPGAAIESYRAAKALRPRGQFFQ